MTRVTKEQIESAKALDLLSYMRLYEPHNLMRKGNFSTNKQIIGRELLLPNEVREIDNEYGVLFIRGAKPVWDKKFKLESHRRNHLTANGNGVPYVHGKDRLITVPFEEFDFENAGYYEVLEYQAF